MKHKHIHLQPFVVAILCVIMATAFAGCSNEEPEEPEFEYCAPNAEGVHITEQHIGDGINIERAFLWVSHNVVISWDEEYWKPNQRVLGCITSQFKHYPMSMDRVEQFIGHYKVVEGEDRHVVDIVTPTKEPILEYLKEHKYEYIASSPYYRGDVFFFNMISDEYYDNLERPGETIYIGDEDLR